MVFSKAASQELQKEYPHASDGQDGVGGVGHVLQVWVMVHLDEVRSGSGRVGTRFEALGELVRNIPNFYACKLCFRQKTTKSLVILCKNVKLKKIADIFTFCIICKQKKSCIFQTSSSRASKGVPTCLRWPRWCRRRR